MRTTSFDRWVPQKSTMLFTVFLEQVCNQGRESVDTQHQKQWGKNVNKRKYIINKNSYDAWPYSIWISISLWKTHPARGEIPESMAEVIRPRSNEPQPQVFLPETLRTPSVRCCPRNSTFHEARMQPGPSSSQLVTIRNSDDVHRVLLCSSPWGSQTSRKGILRDLAIVLNIEYPSQHTKVTVITL